tara:strand:- start:4862 stop:5326 length:465 start_codon:yes stop_codon:yes gene_type:complete
MALLNTLTKNGNKSSMSDGVQREDLKVLIKVLSGVTAGDISVAAITATAIGHADDTDLITLADGSVTFTGSTVVPTADINGGAIDGATIGASSASTGAFTSVTATGAVDIDGAVDMSSTVLMSNASIKMTALPTAASGLAAGTLWNDSGVIKIA